jgi:hypothetical protein
MWVARVGSFLFVLVDQLIILDIAYNWNSSWIDKADQAELLEGVGKGKKWLIAILVSCAIIYITSFVLIVVMYLKFGGCANNNAFISITLAMSFICTVVQMTISETSSLLTSASMTLYATYLCGSAISLNPIGSCNPYLDEKSTWNIVLGLSMAFLGLMWTGWSFTSSGQLGGRNDAANDRDRGDEERPKAGGLVLDNESSPGSHGSSEGSKSIGSSWKLNAILATICCWYAMTLTGWGATEKRGDVANPNVSEVSMWIMISSQWVALLLYLWSLVAPSLFPDRDFS